MTKQFPLRFNVVMDTTELTKVGLPFPAHSLSEVSFASGIIFEQTLKCFFDRMWINITVTGVGETSLSISYQYIWFLKLCKLRFNKHCKSAA